MFRHLISGAATFARVRSSSSLSTIYPGVSSSTVNYHVKAVDHYENPRNVGLFVSPACRDVAIQHNYKLHKIDQSRVVDHSGIIDYFKSPLFASALPKAEEKPRDATANTQQQKKPNDGWPTPDQLQRVADVLESSLKRIFYRQMDYSVYSTNIILIDNIRGKTIQTLHNYARQVAWLRIYAHLRFAYVDYEILNIHQVPQEGRITIRWRIKAQSGLKVFFAFWQLKLWKYKEMKEKYPSWHDGISHYDVGPDGLIFRHVIDKMMEDTERLHSERDRKLRLAAKLAGASTAFVAPLSIVIDGLPSI